MWRVLQHRWIRGSNENSQPPNVVWEGTRKKEALGQGKANLNSHLEMYEKHEFFDYDDVIHVVDKYYAVFYCAFLEDGKIVYFIRYEVQEYDADSSD